jgi:hypothetical protein
LRAAIFIALAGLGMAWALGGQGPLHGTGTVLSLGRHGIGTVPDLGRDGVGKFSPGHWTIPGIQLKLYTVDYANVWIGF